jgi:signal transduction histidine kinase
LPNAEAAAAAARCAPPTGGRPVASLADVDIVSELQTRPRRQPNFEHESLSLGMLASELATNPRNMLQRLVEIAADLCTADTAGLSLLNGDVFRWEAVTGTFAAAKGGTMPRAESPCGVCIDRDATQLMHLPDRAFPALYAEPRFVEALLIPFHNNGSPIGTVWVVSHTSDRKFDAEDERVVGVLAQFASSAWQLWKLYEAAAEDGERKSGSLALIGHELRDPLATATASVALLRSRISAVGGDIQPLDVIARQCQHMSRLVDDLLDVAGTENKKLRLDKSLIDVRTIVANAVDAKRQQVEGRRHMLEADLGSEPILVEADPLRITQVVSNLLDNAAKYTPDGGCITVAVSRRSAEVHIAVDDTGSGIPAEQLTNIFKPFTQLDMANPKRRGGLGLGLSLVQRLTELHGGSVHATSRGQGQGSCFTVRLPVAADR